MDSDDPAARLVGMWRLEEAFVVDGQGRRIGPAFGAEPTGYIVYRPDGMMITLVADAARPNLSGDRLAAPVEERAAAFSGTSAYAGRWRFDGKTVVHAVEVASVPNWVGTEVVRHVEIDGDRAVYRTAPQVLNGVETVIRLVWRRHGS